MMGARLRYDAGMAPPPSIRNTLAAHGQAHLLTFFERLDAAAQAGLLRQIESIDFEALDDLIETYVRHQHAFALPADLAPAAFYPHDSRSGPRAYDAAKF